MNKSNFKNLQKCLSNICKEYPDFSSEDIKNSLIEPINTGKLDLSICNLSMDHNPEKGICYWYILAYGKDLQKYVKALSENDSDLRIKTTESSISYQGHSLSQIKIIAG